MLEKNKGYIYLDSSATSLRHKNVLKKIIEYNEEYTSNVYRSQNKLSERATIEYEKTRELLSELINCRKDEIIFTSNSTDSINLLANANFLSKESEVIISEIEHHSNFLPWMKYNVKIVKVDEFGLIDIEDLKRKITNKTTLLSFTGVSNIAGNFEKIEEIVRICKSKNILTMCDMTQYIPHRKVNLSSLDLDFISFSSHKMFGPGGVGVLYGKYSLLEQMFPIKLGGGTIKALEKDLKFSLKDIPYCFEAGTPAIENIIAFKEALVFLRDKVYPNEEHLKFLEKEFRKGLKNRDYLEKSFGFSKDRIPIFSLYLKGIENKEKISFLLETLSNTYNIFVNYGYHCSQYIHRKNNKAETIRISFQIYNDKSDIDSFFNAMDELKCFFH